MACVGIRYEASEELRSLCDSFQLVGVAKLGRMIRALSSAPGARRIVMAGKVTKNVIYTPWRVLQLCPDLRTVQWWYRRTPRRQSRRFDLAVADREFERDGMTFASALDYCPELLVKDRNSHPPRPDIRRSRRTSSLAGRSPRKWAGSTLANQSPSRSLPRLAVEAIEGTDRCIERAGQFCRAGGWSLVKVAKPQQDMRFDVPTIGVTTIENLHKAGCQGAGDRGRQDDLARRAGSSRLANRYGLSIVAIMSGVAHQARLIEDSSCRTAAPSPIGIGRRAIGAACRWLAFADSIVWARFGRVEAEAAPP